MYMSSVTVAEVRLVCVFGIAAQLWKQASGEIAVWPRREGRVGIVVRDQFEDSTHLAKSPFGLDGKAVWKYWYVMRLSTRERETRIWRNRRSHESFGVGTVVVAAFVTHFWIPTISRSLCL